MLKNYSNKLKYSWLFLMLIFAGLTLQAQTEKRVRPIWWFGESGAVNFNYYRGTTQMLTDNYSTPVAFHKGNSVKPYGSLLIEYRPKRVIGVMLNIAYDDRGGKFDQQIAPCNCPADVTTKLNYVSFEPSLRIAPFSSAFYVFAGPTLSVNVSKEFIYTQQNQTDIRGDWSEVNKTVFAAQAGAGIDIPLSKKSSTAQMTISPFVSFQTDLFQSPRSVESWSIYTYRAGIALKFGSGKSKKSVNTIIHDTINTNLVSILSVPVKEIQFTVRSPKAVPFNRQVRETFPLRNSVFFTMGSVEIPVRYIQLNQGKANTFSEQQLQKNQPDNLNHDRSARQLNVYYNILNIVGDRLRLNPKSTITLIGSADKNPVEGKIMAEKIKSYLVAVFGIDASRISTEGRDKPIIPSEQPGATKDLALLREGDRRVDIISNSPELLLQVGGANSDFLRPVQINAVQTDPLDSHVIFTAAGAADLLDSWSVTVTDEQGHIQNYGPYTQDQASVPGKTILGNNQQGNYTIQMTGLTKTGKTITKGSFVSLMTIDNQKQVGLRYSILFDFDRSKTIASYEKFLSDIIVPLIPENGTVIIQGHTDIIGEEKYNLNLSVERAEGAQKILERALANAGKKGVKFETYGFGKEPDKSPFDNALPEERFYNRTVIIDIIAN
jgi:outer membrane protein OmpA-like peptidoglycan-associated protein